MKAEAVDLAGFRKMSPTVTVQKTFGCKTVAFAAPTPGPTASIYGAQTLAATVTSEHPVTKVEFFVSGVLVGTDTTSPYAVAWAAGGSSTGTITVSKTLLVTVTDSYGQTVSATQLTGVKTACPAPCQQ